MLNHKYVFRTIALVFLLNINSSAFGLEDDFPLEHSSPQTSREQLINDHAWQTVNWILSIGKLSIGYMGMSYAHTFFHELGHALVDTYFTGTFPKMFMGTKAMPENPTGLSIGKITFVGISGDGYVDSSELPKLTGTQNVISLAAGPIQGTAIFYTLFAAYRLFYNQSLNPFDLFDEIAEQEIPPQGYLWKMGLLVTTLLEVSTDLFSGLLPDASSPHNDGSKIWRAMTTSQGLAHRGESTKLILQAIFYGYTLWRAAKATWEYIYREQENDEPADEPGLSNEPTGFALPKPLPVNVPFPED